MKYIGFFTLFFIGCLFAAPAQAVTTFSFNHVSAEDEAVVTAYAEITENPVNAFQGEVVVENAYVKSINQANSILANWIDFEKLTPPRNGVSFAGITPGGIWPQRSVADTPQSTRSLFAFTVVPIDDTQPIIVQHTADATLVLTHTPTPRPDRISFPKPYIIDMEGGVAATTTADVVPPEFVAVTTYYDELLGQEVAHVVVRDNQSGVKVVEGFWNGVWHAVGDPFVLPDAITQLRAFDQAGNVSYYDFDGVAAEPAAEKTYSIWWLFGVFIILWLIFFVWRRRKDEEESRRL